MSTADVFALDALSAAICDLQTAQRETGECCDEEMRNAERTREDAQQELQFSEGLLVAAQDEEAAKLALFLKAQARLAEAIAEETAAIGSGNPFAIAAASAEVAAARAELAEAQEEYQRAREHRERLEHRKELAQRCVDIAQEMLETLSLRCQYGRTQIDELVFSGSGRLRAALSDLSEYLSRVPPQARQQARDYWNWQPAEKQPVNPKDIHDRLNPDAIVVDSLLEYLYATDPKFHASIDRICCQIKNQENIDAVEVNIKSNIVGRLCEELVILAFKPMGERIETQQVYHLGNGSFTKVDMILYGLKEPVILGRGEGMSGKKGGSLAIEVKSGQPDYIYSQIAHMETQAKGHQSADASCTVCTRDIMRLPPEKQQEVRERLKDAGSPILGMLPAKQELDDRCVQFVKRKAEKSNVS